MATHKIIVAPVSSVFADYERNYRDPEADYLGCLPTEGYDHAKFLAGTMAQGLFEDILYNGVLTPIWVSVLTASQRAEVKARTEVDYLYRVIRGHKRFKTVQNINERFPGKITELELDAYSGLTELEEWERMTDHGKTQQEEPLSELGEYRAVVNLFAAGFSQERIANMFGQKRGWSMRRVWIHQTGADTPTERHYLARLRKAEKGTFLSFPISDMDKLYPAWKADHEAKPVRDPMAEGSTFYKVWASYEETGKKPPEERALTRKAIDERASFVEGRPPLVEMVKFATGRGGNAKTAAEMYDRIAKKAEESETLRTELDASNVKIGDLTARLETAEATIATLTAELEAAKAELTEARKPQIARKGK